MDPSSHKTQEQQDFEQAVQALPEALQRLCLSGQSVQNLSHLVKNTLQITSGSIEIIELGLKRKQFDRVERSWGIFELNFVRMKKFILDLIKYTKQYPLQKTACNLNQCADRAIDACEYALKNGAVKIQLRKDKTIPSTSLDADRIEEMSANLITHALDNLPEHAGTISITTKYLEEHNQIQLSVGDDGPGLSDKTIRSLAEPHERTQNMCGTGFDIPLAKIYIEQHEGYMEFESSEPKGNCVHAYLPIQ
ncbi:MAG: HAMP domain-containing histidine kinase [Planctomycetes bacterium]|nr:HAMP domain-containing histidine kinase [Planctomycetota bacterium]